jgi:hypothetical protein
MQPGRAPIKISLSIEPSLCKHEATGESEQISMKYDIKEFKLNLAADSIFIKIRQKQLAVYINTYVSFCSYLVKYLLENIF